MSQQADRQRAYHLIEPVYNEDSKILILGSFPSVKSREAMFFYHHPQNRFWKVLSGLFWEDTPETIPERKQFLLEHNIALWDVISSCEINGSSDCSIRNVEVNNLEGILKKTDIRRIYTNGGLADKLYHRYFDERISLPVTRLPSTSPANAAYSLQRLLECWRVIRESV